MKIDLYLNNQLVEINKDIDFVLNKQFTDLTDLTSIIVDYSKTVKVPMTAKNNELFNYTYKFERQVLLNGDVVSYDPTQKMSMTMVFNGNTVMEGYAVLNSVNLKDRTYEINLYGQLGKIFKDMKEKTLKDYKKDTSGFWDYIRMNTYNVAKSFTNDSKNMSWSSTDWSDFFGFAPQMMGKTDLIDTKSYEVNNVSVEDRVKTFADTINTTRSIDYADIYVGDGFDINQYQEIRTYMTRPYVYVDKLVKLVQNELNNSDYDGYTLTLNSDWFNNNNPYYKDMCFFPGTETVVDSGESTNGLVTWSANEITLTFPMVYLPSATTDLDGYTYSVNNNVVTVTNSDASSELTATLTLNCDRIITRDRITNVGDTTNFNTKGRWAYYNRGYAFTIRYIGIYDANDSLLYKLYLCDDTLRNVVEEWGAIYYNHRVDVTKSVWSKLRGMDNRIITPNNYQWANSSSGHNYCELTQQFDFGNIVLPTNSFKFKMQCDEIVFSPYTNTAYIANENINVSDYHTLCPFKNDNYKTRLWTDNSNILQYFKPIREMTVTSSNYRSNSYWSIFEILGNDFNPFTWLIDYAKKFRLFFDIDYSAKTINLKSGYFNSITYKKVNVDYNKDVIIEPIVNKYKYVNFGYKENNGKKFKKYLKNYGVAYGDIDLDTHIDINNEKMSLLPNKDESVFIPVKLETLTYGTLNSTNPLKFTNPLQTARVINTLNADDEIEYFQFYAFRLQNKTNSLIPGADFYWISDDTPDQRNSGEYIYLDKNSGWQSEVETTEDGNNVYYLKGMNEIPQFDNNYPYATQVFGQFNITWSTFTIPKEVYNGYVPSTLNNYCIYNTRWESFLNEIFNQNNKKVTCYVRLSYPEFINFKFNQVWVIDGSTFLVNKIIDFNPNSIEPTKVELIQISDVANLK